MLGAREVDSLDLDPSTMLRHEPPRPYSDSRLAYL